MTAYGKFCFMTVDRANGRPAATVEMPTLIRSSSRCVASAVLMPQYKKKKLQYEIRDKHQYSSSISRSRVANLHTFVPGKSSSGHSRSTRNETQSRGGWLLPMLLHIQLSSINCIPFIFASKSSLRLESIAYCQTLYSLRFTYCHQT